MALFSFKKKVLDPADSGAVEKGKRTIKRSPPVAMEVKLLALEGLEAGLSAEEVGELAGLREGRFGAGAFPPQVVAVRVEDTAAVANRRTWHMST
jgi:hypothetical protein